MAHLQSVRMVHIKFKKVGSAKACIDMTATPDPMMLGYLQWQVHIALQTPLPYPLLVESAQFLCRMEVFE
eukprot:m.153082 g.153082  ORF g.153082 m.153082 type:complete len:70 (-) comp14280_c0_seq4:510-719(-)